MKVTNKDWRELRDCPFCGTKQSVDPDAFYNVQMTATSIIANDCTYEIFYGVNCSQCGVHVDAEYIDEAANLWNGVEPDVED